MDLPDYEQRYARYEMYPCIYNDVEAWVFTNNVWHETDSFLMHQDAGMMTKEDFDGRWPSLPPLPKEAFTRYTAENFGKGVGATPPATKPS
jgi:hypothetical protein